MRRDLLHIVVALQVRTADIQRNIWRVDYTMKQCQVLWHNILYLVGYEHLVAIELNLIALNINIILDTCEVEDTRKIEWVIHIEMDMEKWLIHLMRIELVIELLVILIG